MTVIFGEVPTLLIIINQLDKARRQLWVVLVLRFS